MPAQTFQKHLLLERLVALRARTRLHLAIDGVASTSLAFVTICLVSFGVDRVFRLPQGQRAIMLAILVGACGTLVWRRLISRLRVALPLVELARAVEKRSPQLDWRLVSAVQFLENEDPRGSFELARMVVDEAQVAAANIAFSDVLDTSAVGLRAFKGGVVLACGLALVLGFTQQARTWFQRCILLSSTIEWPKDTQLIITTQCGAVVNQVAVIENGLQVIKTIRVAVPRGSDLAVIVSARGSIPTRATVSFEFASSHIRGKRQLARLGDNRFRHVFEKVGEDCTFTVSGGDDEVGPIKVQVVRPPWIDSFQIEAEPPRYTRLPKKTYGPESGEIALPAGTMVTIKAHCAKKLKEAWADVRIAGASLEAPAERHEFPSRAMVEKCRADTKGAIDHAEYADALGALMRLADAAQVRASGDEKRWNDLAAFRTQLAGIAPPSSASKGQADPALQKMLGDLLVDARLNGALEPLVDTTDDVAFKFLLDKTATCAIDVRDDDELSLERPVAITLRSIPDAPPKVQLQANGIGQLITPECEIPVVMNVVDDYGIQRVVIKWKTAGPNQQPREGTIVVPNVVPEPPGTPLNRDMTLSFSLDVGELHLAPGTFFSFVCEAQDNDPKGAKTTMSSSYALRIVAPEELLMDLIRRQHELRRELERTRDEETKLAEGLESLDSKAQERAGKKQREVIKLVADTARAMSLVVDEMRNNHLLDERARTRLQDDVVTPLETLRDGELVRSRDLSDETLKTQAEADRANKSRDAGASTREVVAQLDKIISHMKQVTDLAELIARLREFIKKQRDLMEETRKTGASH
jgi:hypothetical protein